MFVDPKERRKRERNNYKQINNVYNLFQIDTDVRCKYCINYHY